MTLRSRDKMALAGVVVVLLAVAFYFLVIAPVNHRASNLNASLAAQQQTLAQDEATYGTGKAAQTTLKKQQGQWQALGRAVPATANIPALLRVVSAAAKASGTSFQSISLSGGTAAAGATPSTGTSQTGAATAVPISLTFTGNYAQLDHVIHHLDTLTVISGNRVRASGPLLSISSVSLTGTAPKLTAQLSASIYQLDSSSSAGSSGSTTTLTTPTTTTSSTSPTAAAS